MHDLIVIGGGPAGLAAMVYALDKRLDAVMICEFFGGKVDDRLPFGDQRADGEALVGRFKERLLTQPHQLVDDLVLSVTRVDTGFQVQTRHTLLRSRTILVATGAQPIHLGVPNERHLVGHGLGYAINASMRGVAGRDVAVVGTTSRALRGVAELIGVARQVLLIAPTSGELGGPLGRTLRNHPAVQVLEGYKVRAIEAEGGAVHAVIVGRSENGSQQRIPIHAVFVDLGLVPNVEFVRQLVQLDGDGFIVVDDRNRTSLPGLFAAGDVTTVAGDQVLIAIGEGARAAQSAYDYILARRLGLSK